MHLAQLRAENFRLFERLSLQPHCRLNFVVGENAAGKTSVLEAIYCLMRARSFRSSSAAEMAGRAQRQWQLAGEMKRAEALPQNLHLKWDAGTTEILLDRRPATTLELVRGYPVQIMEPGMHRLLQEGPGYRRSFLDWGVFHVEQDFMTWWRRFQRALKQRNHALRMGSPGREVQAWNQELAETAIELNVLRERHIEQLKTVLAEKIERLLRTQNWQLELSRGWGAGDYRELLESALERDRRQGMTVEGPHRAELRIRLHDHQAKSRASRGQQKLLICALILAQAELIYASTGLAPILLVDDFGAELAHEYQRVLLEALLRYPGQVFITAFERQGVLAQSFDAAMFHVEQGGVTPL